MAHSPPSNRLTLHLTEDMSAPQGIPQHDAPFRILLLGNFSGRHQSETPNTIREQRLRKPLPVDRDNVDEVMDHIGVRLDLPMGEFDNQTIPLPLKNLDAFCPDQLVTLTDRMRPLLDLRSRLRNTKTFPAAAAELHALAPISRILSTQQAANPKNHDSIGRPSSSNAELLGEMLAEAEGTSRAGTAVESAGDWREFLRSIAAPFLVPGADPQQDEYVRHVDTALSAMMRAILHHPVFQAMEAAWRGLAFLVSRLETGTELQLYVLDITQAELAADVLDREDLEGADCYRILVEETLHTPGGRPWAVIGGLYIFGESEEDLRLLARIALLAQQARAPFIAAASPRLLGCARIHDTPNAQDWQPVEAGLRQRWTELRRTPAARHLGLVLPRFLLRLPYGPDTDAIDGFAFEEMTEDARHEDYLWANPVIACLSLLGASFIDAGWSLRPGQNQEIEGLPLHVHTDHGSRCLIPCAETLLTEHTAHQILEQGLMPLLSLKDQDTVRLARFQSIADPPTPLAAQWSG